MSDLRCCTTRLPDLILDPTGIAEASSRGSKNFISSYHKVRRSTCTASYASALAVQCRINQDRLRFDVESGKGGPLPRRGRRRSRRHYHLAFTLRRPALKCSSSPWGDVISRRTPGENARETINRPQAGPPKASQRKSIRLRWRATGQPDRPPAHARPADRIHVRAARPRFGLSLYRGRTSVVVPALPRRRTYAAQPSDIPAEFVARAGKRGCVAPMLAAGQIRSVSAAPPAGSNEAGYDSLRSVPSHPRRSRHWDKSVDRSLCRSG